MESKLTDDTKNLLLSNEQLQSSQIRMSHDVKASVIPSFVDKRNQQSLAVDRPV